MHPTSLTSMNEYQVVLSDEVVYITSPDDMAAAYAAKELSLHLEQDLFDVIPMKNRKEFPNKWKAWSNVPAEMFEPVEYETLMKMRVGDWELNPDTYCVFRFKNITTGKITEKAYKSKKHALAALTKHAVQGDTEIVMVDDTSINYYDPLTMGVDLDELF